MLPLGHWEMIFSLREETVIDWLYLEGPMSVPSASLNLSSIQSSPAISLFPPPKPPNTKKRFKSLHLFSLWGISSNTRHAFSPIQPKYQNPNQVLLKTSKPSCWNRRAKRDCLQKETDFNPLFDGFWRRTDSIIIERFSIKKKMKEKEDEDEDEDEEEKKRDALGCKAVSLSSTDFNLSSEILLYFDFSTLLLISHNYADFFF